MERVHWCALCSVRREWPSNRDQEIYKNISTITNVLNYRRPILSAEQWNNSRVRFTVTAAKLFGECTYQLFCCEFEFHNYTGSLKQINKITNK